MCGLNLRKYNQVGAARKRKKTALVLSHDGKEFWATQNEFWQWVKYGVVKKIRDNPLTGVFLREHEEKLVPLSHTVLNIAAPNHLREVMLARRGRRRLSG